jgi:hypothetical protein
MLMIKINRIIIFFCQTGQLNWSDRSTRLIYMANLMAPLHRTSQVDQFPYLICPNQTQDKKVIEFVSFYIF